KRPNRLCPVADPILHFGRQPGKSLSESVRNKNWIVAESLRAARSLDNSSFDGSFERAEQLAFVRKRNHATKARRSRGAQVCNLPCAGITTCNVVPHSFPRKVAKYLVDVL